jgi:ribosomal protein S18 acetylase RimI-like enzyme
VTSRASWQTRRLTDKASVLAILQTDRLYAAYAIGDLGDNLFSLCDWIAADEGHGPSALAMMFNGFHPPALFVMGEADGVQAILSSLTQTAAVQMTYCPEHAAAVARYYRCGEARHMWRMAVDGSTFVPAAGPVERLSSEDLMPLNELYAWGGHSFFSGYQLDEGVYFGVRQDGKLLAAAGTHVVTPEYGIAAVGNVYTHPDQRNRGYATACTGAVVAELLRLGCSSVVLNVWQENAPAVRAYEKLGFRAHCSYLEAPAARKSHAGQIRDAIFMRRSPNDGQA